MSDRKSRFKNLQPVKDEILEDFFDNGLNISQISKKYQVHYSNLRRFIKEEIRDRGLEDSYNLQHLNVEDFPYLRVGHTFAFATWLSVWKVTKMVEKENQLCWEMVPTNYPARTHWVCGENTPEAVL